jgi:hypothetical protein
MQIKLYKSVLLMNTSMNWGPRDQSEVFHYLLGIRVIYTWRHGKNRLFQPPSPPTSRFFLRNFPQIVWRSGVIYGWPLKRALRSKVQQNIFYSQHQLTVKLWTQSARICESYWKKFRFSLLFGSHFLESHREVSGDSFLWRIF